MNRPRKAREAVQRRSCVGVNVTPLSGAPSTVVRQLMAGMTPTSPAASGMVAVATAAVCGQQDKADSTRCQLTLRSEWLHDQSWCFPADFDILY